jgi:hypothetical protein
MLLAYSRGLNIVVAASCFARRVTTGLSSDFSPSAPRGSSAGDCRKAYAGRVATERRKEDGSARQFFDRAHSVIYIHGG